MHQVVIAQTRLDRLLYEIGRVTVPFKVVPPGQETINRNVDGWPLLAGEVNGLSYLYEDHGTVFALCWSLLTSVSRELDSLVVGSSFDAMEEHCQFFVANKGEVVRAF